MNWLNDKKLNVFNINWKRIILKIPIIPKIEELLNVVRGILILMCYKKPGLNLTKKLYNKDEELRQEIIWICTNSEIRIKTQFGNTEPNSNAKAFDID